MNARQENIYATDIQLIPRSRVLPENLTVPQPAKKFSAFYGTRRFINAFTSARQLFLNQINPVQDSPTPFSKIHFNSILRLPSGFYSLGLP